MHEIHHFLQAIAVVLCVAAVTTVVFQRLRQPVVMGYLLAGLIVGRYLPAPLMADREVVRTLSEIGVILLMFALGLEFSLRKLMRVGATASVTAVIECALMIRLGFTVGQAFGWTRMESIFAGSLVAISSTTIIAKVFDEQNVRGRLRERVVGVLVVEDLIAVLLMATLTAVASGSGLSAGAVAVTVGKLVAFLAGLIVLGLLLIPRAVRYVAKLGRPETTIVACVGICFGISLLAAAFGYSVALGAFLAGTLVAESGQEKPIEHLVRPVRDVFAAIFFVSVGMMIDPSLVVGYWAPILVLTVVVIGGKVIGVSLGALLTGSGIRASVQTAMSLAQIGEFSFIIAALGLSLGATGEFLYPVAVMVSAVTTLTTPWLIKSAGPVATFVDSRLPGPLQTVVTLYGSWVEKLSSPRKQGGTAGGFRRVVRLILLDAALLAGVTIAGSLAQERLSERAGALFGVSERLAGGGIILLAVLVAAPFMFGIVRMTRRLGVLLAEGALPSVAPGKLDLAAAPRRVLVVTLQLALVLVIGLPMIAITQPFLPPLLSALLLIGTFTFLAVTFWRRAADLQGHVKAGAQAIVAALAEQSQSADHDDHAAELQKVHQTLPGLGDPVPVTVEAGSPVVGKTLAAINLRGATGATVLVIKRGEDEVVLPTAEEVLRAGDVLALAGSAEAVEAAAALVAGRSRPSGEFPAIVPAA